MNNSERRNPPRRHGRMGPPGMGGGEKAKNFSGTWKKLLLYCRKYIVFIVIALLCAAVGTVCMLIGPDKLSDMTEVITDGIKPDTEALAAVTEKMTENITKNMTKVVSAITENLSDQESLMKNAAAVMTSEDISDEDKAAFQNVVAGLRTSGDAAAAHAAIMSLPDSVLNVLFSSITVNDSEIPAADQIRAVTVLSSLENAADSDEAFQEILEKLPDPVRDALYTTVVVNGVVISGSDQQKMLRTLSTMDVTDSAAALSSMEGLPASVKRLISSSVDMDQIFVIGMTLVVLYSLSYILAALQGYIMATVTQRVSKRMRTDISRKINRLPMWFYDRTATGDILSRVTNDVDTIGQSLNQSIGTLISAVVLLFGSLFMMIKTNGILTITAVLASLIGFFLMFAIMGRSQKYFSRQQKHLGGF